MWVASDYTSPTVREYWKYMASVLKTCVSEEPIKPLKVWSVEL